MELITKFHKNGRVWRQGFYEESICSGEFVEYFDNGQIFIDCCYYKGGVIGDYNSYTPEGEPAERYFYVKNSLVRIPYLSSKPRRLPRPSNRNRFETLEI